ncbi:protein of unknown function [Candidatus Methylomirabilis oxygeniifera]|uniref:Uncharacterized protein n=1 Tax=Methylomirabilis oxygeniifera TaxID=671143 RepID=D5MIN5_METO1|nr:protein of unknown function [Candidatus Methylomirabilis oxyfera]
MELKAGMVEDLLKTPLFEPDVVGVVEIIDPDNEVTGMEEQLGDLAADEARTTCQYNGPWFQRSVLGALHPHPDDVSGAAFGAIA